LGDVCTGKIHIFLEKSHGKVSVATFFIESKKILEIGGMLHCLREGWTPLTLLITPIY